MASLFNSKHNKYVSIPDWFKDIKPVEEQIIETKTTYISGGSVVSPTSGLSSIAIYNKFVLKDAELDNAALIVKDIALNGIETEQYKIGDEVPAIGWGTTGYISVAGSSIISVISVLLENDHGFGVIFYDNTLTIIGNVILQNSTEEITTPNNTYYFRISAPYNNTSFKVKYYKTETYNQEQLQLSNQNVTDYLSLNDLIPEGKNEITFSSDKLKLLVQPPLSLTKDMNNVIKLSVDNIIQNQTNNLTIWGKQFDGKSNIDGDISNVGNISFQSAGKQIGKWGLGAELTYSNAIISKGSGQSLWLVGSSLTDSNGIVFAKNDDGTRSDEIARINSIGFYPYITDSLSLGTVEKKWNNVYSKKTTINDIELYQSQANTLFINGNLVVSGGITMYGTDGTIAPSIWEGAPIANTNGKKGVASYDPNFFSVNNGVVTFIGSTGGGGIESITKQMVIDALGYTPYNSANPSGYITSSGNITGNAATATTATNATNVLLTGSSNSGTFRVVYASVENGLGNYNPLYVDSVIGAGYNPATNTFIASAFEGDEFEGGTFYGDTFQLEPVSNAYTAANLLWKSGSTAYGKMAANDSGDVGIYARGSVVLRGGGIDSSAPIYGIKLDTDGTTNITSSKSYAIVLNRAASSGGSFIKAYANNQTKYSWAFGTNNTHQFSVWYQDMNSSIDSQKMYIDSSGNMLVTGGITMYSDLRKKTILNHVELSLKEVADAPLIEHYYNSDEKKTTHVGSIAQYWAGLNDWFCKKDDDGYYTMEIQNAALASAISVAREVMRYESKTDKQIQSLKKRICELEDEVEILKNK